jgi:hypothetical protein
MTKARTTRAARRTARRGAVVARQRKAKAVVALQAPPVVLFRLCKPGWAVIVEKAPSALGTRFVCPFCPLSHRVPGPVRGFRKLRRAQWVKLRRVHE